MSRPLKPGYRPNQSDVIFLTLVKAEEVLSNRGNWLKQQQGSKRTPLMERKYSKTSQTPSTLQGKTYNCVETTGGNAIDSRPKQLSLLSSSSNDVLCFSGLPVSVSDDERGRLVQTVEFSPAQHFQNECHKLRPSRFHRARKPEPKRSTLRPDRSGQCHFHRYKSSR